MAEESLMTASSQEVIKKFELVLVNKNGVCGDDMQQQSKKEEKELSEAKEKECEESISDKREEEDEKCEEVTNLGQRMDDELKENKEPATDATRLLKQTTKAETKKTTSSSWSKIKHTIGSILIGFFNTLIFVFFNHLSIIFYMMSSAFGFYVYFLPDLFNETFLTETIDSKTKAAVLFIQFILIQNVYLTLNHKSSRFFRVFAIPLTWLFIVSCYYIAMIFVQTYTNYQQFNLQLIEMAMANKHEDYQAKFEQLQKQVYDQTNKQGGLNSNTDALLKTTGSFTFPSFFSMFL